MVWNFVHERVHEVPLTGGGSTYRKSVPPDALIVSAAKRLLDALKWHGVAMVEFKRDDNGTFHLMEINPRLWGSLALAIDAGVDFPWGLWLIANRHPVGPQPLYRVPYYSRYLPGDVEWMKENLKANHADPLLMTRPIVRSMVEYLRPFIGRESWDHFRWSDPGICLRQVREVVSDNFRNLKRRLERLVVARKLRHQHRRLQQDLSYKRGTFFHLLFLCYGNICRSPFAEAYAVARLPEVRVQSAGLHEEEGRPSPEHLASAAAELGMTLAMHRSRHLNPKMIDQADLIVVMDLMNYESLVREYPTAASKTTCLGLFASEPSLEIDDPYLLSTEQTITVLRQIISGVDGIERVLRGSE
jgi:protein-tyrosine-phosphatase